MRAHRKEVNDLVADLQRSGYLVSMPSTASDYRALRNARQMLRRIGYVS